ncbi:MAG: gamma-glutamyltransferase [Balneolaceae bacterium]|nr:gamma-glutamyltransferase [Balneolaceae bacterium]
MKCAVAAGHTETAKSAANVLKEGGNAFDAVVAAHLTACVAEPVLSSLGGGGFLLAKSATGKSVCYDFFAQTPFVKNRETAGSFFNISADFGTVKQNFRVGPGSIATPGTVKGLFSIHKDLCSMPFERLADHASNLAKNGVVMNKFQAEILRIVKPIYQIDSDVKKYFSSDVDGNLLREGDLFKNPEFADVLEGLSKEGEAFFYDGEIAKSIQNVSAGSGGHLTAEDLKNYEVERREPLACELFNNTFIINPPPASGGILVAFAAKLCEAAGLNRFKPGTADYLERLAEVQKLTNKARIEQVMDDQSENRLNELLGDDLINLYRAEISQRFSSGRGTTQISVADQFGNFASLTTSNGEGSGVLVPGTSIMMNNMLGEEDLFPGGAGSWEPNQRISSMMAPGILQLNDGQEIAFGSGGSNRIRTAILQVLLNIMAYQGDIRKATEASRIHVEGDTLNIEGGFDMQTIRHLEKLFKDTEIWDNQSLFFGGVHLVGRSKDGLFSGFGDPRRGGVFLTVD